MDRSGVDEGVIDEWVVDDELLIQIIWNLQKFIKIFAEPTGIEV